MTKRFEIKRFILHEILKTYPNDTKKESLTKKIQKKYGGEDRGIKKHYEQLQDKFNLIENGYGYLSLKRSATTCEYWKHAQDKLNIIESFELYKTLVNHYEIPSTTRLDLIKYVTEKRIKRENKTEKEKRRFIAHWYSSQCMDTYVKIRVKENELGLAKSLKENSFESAQTLIESIPELETDLDKYKKELKEIEEKIKETKFPKTEDEVKGMYEFLKYYLRT